MYFYASEEPDLPPLNPPPAQPPLEGQIEENVYRGNDSPEGGLGPFLKDLARAFLEGAATAARTVGNIDVGTPLKTALNQDEIRSGRPVHIPMRPPLETRNVIPLQGFSRASAIRRQQFAEQEEARRQARYEREMAKIQENIHNKATAYAKQRGLEQFIRPITSRLQQPTDLDTTRAADTGISLNQVLNPSAGQRAWINETLPTVSNIQGVQNPLTQQEYRQQQNALAMQQAQLDATIARERHFREQALNMKLAQEYQGFPKHKHLSKSYLEIDKVLKGQALTHKELRQFFHILDLERFQAQKADNLSGFLKVEDQLIERLASNIIKNSNVRLSDGYILIGEKGYQPRFALSAAKNRLRFFQENDKFPPLDFPTDPKKVDKILHDRTAVYEKQLSETALIMKALPTKTPRAGKLLLIASLFGNNDPFDMQGRIDLPGQVIDTRNNVPIPDPKHAGRYKSKDQYAIYDKEAKDAGWFSNYIVGHAVSYADLSVYELILGVEGYSLWSNRKTDSPKDLNAALQGYERGQKEQGKYDPKEMENVRKILKERGLL